jgi:hypothetical protein
MRLLQGDPLAEYWSTFAVDSTEDLIEANVQAARSRAVREGEQVSECYT